MVPLVGSRHQPGGKGQGGQEDLIGSHLIHTCTPTGTCSFCPALCQKIKSQFLWTYSHPFCVHVCNTNCMVCRPYRVPRTWSGWCWDITKEVYLYTANVISACINTSDPITLKTPHALLITQFGSYHEWTHTNTQQWGKLSAESLPPSVFYERVVWLLNTTY